MFATKALIIWQLSILACARTYQFLVTKHFEGTVDTDYDKQFLFLGMCIYKRTDYNNDMKQVYLNLSSKVSQTKNIYTSMQDGHYITINSIFAHMNDTVSCLY